MKLRKTIQNGHFTAKVYADVEWSEYRVKYSKDGKYLGEDCDSFESEETDAIQTASAELEFMNEKETT
jgi:hypothetical protein